MAEGKKKIYDLGRSGTVTVQLSDDAKRLLVSLGLRKEGLSKTGLNGLIEALEDIRKKMER